MIVLVPFASSSILLLLMHSRLLSFVMFLDSTRGPNSIVQWCILHAFHNGFPTSIDFFGVVRTKSCGDGRSIVHPTFQFELPNNLCAVGFGSTLRHLISTNVGFVQVMHEINSQLDQKVALCLIVIGIVEPIVKIRFVAKPQHGVAAILNPKGLLPLFHHNGTKRDSRKNVSLFAHQFSFGKRGRSGSGLLR